MYHVPSGALISAEDRAKFLKDETFERKLNIGCGTDYIDGWVNLDGCKEVKADVYCDLDDELLWLPFADAEFDLIYACHILEHIVHLPELKIELSRITKLNGQIVVVAPYYLSRDAWGDDTHVRAFSEHSFFSNFWPGFKYVTHALIPTKDGLGLENEWILGVMKKIK